MATLPLLADLNTIDVAADRDSMSQGRVEIIPLEGDLGKVVLEGDALPFKGMEFPTEQRLSTKYYPGNPVATQQVGGPVKPPSTWMGHWMDVTLGEGGARQLVLQFEYLCERGIPVEVRWGGRQLTNGEDPAVVRRGLIKKFTPKYQRAQDVEWSCEWEWRGEVIQTKPPTFAAEGFASSWDFSALSDQLEDTQNETTSWMDVVWSIMGAETDAMLTISDALDDVQNAIVNAIDVVDAASGTISEVASLPSSINDRIQGVCSRIVLACANGRAAGDDFCGLWPGIGGAGAGQDFRDTGVIFRQQAGEAKLAMYSHDDPLERLDGQTAQDSLIRSWDLLAEQASVASAKLAAQQVPDVIAIVRPPAGSDLRDLAVKFYGDPDLWLLIADYNDLDTSEVPATPTGPSDTGAPPIYIPRHSDISADQTNTWGDAP